MYVRVHNPDTGHEYDLPEDHPTIRNGLVAIVKGSKPSPLPRPAKHAGKAKARPKPAKARTTNTKPPAAQPDQSAPTGTPDAN